MAATTESNYDAGNMEFGTSRVQDLAVRLLADYNFATGLPGLGLPTICERRNRCEKYFF